ncbi:MAG: HAMP domain-containing histidine kinase [Myxococcales bacterium]|nr:HAMP domain-containing histidine kinase [Myxococcales bacterium]
MRDLESLSTTDLHSAGADLVPAPDAQTIAALTVALAGRDSFLQVIGHELRNAIGPMRLLIEQLQGMADDPAAPAALASRVVMLRRNLDKLRATIDRVAEVSALRRGTLSLTPTQVNLGDVLAEVCHEAAREAEAGRAQLILGVTEEVEGSWDRARLKQIAENLVSNAIRYSGGGRIEIDVVDRGSAGELIVRDHGPGLPAELLPHLFEPFGPLDLERTRRTGGFGIGLWVVKTLCTAMQGMVTAENDPTGGARFCVVLPRG